MDEIIVAATDVCNESATETYAEFSPKPRLMSNEDYLFAIERCAAEVLRRTALEMANGDKQLALSAVASITQEVNDLLRAEE